MENQKLTCEFCGESKWYKQCGFAMHLRICKCNPNRRPLENNGNKNIYKYSKHKSDYTIWKCKDCNICFETKAKLYDHRHEVHGIVRNKICKKCDKHYELTLVKHNKECIAINHSHKHTEETKKIISEKLKKYYKDNPDKHFWKNNTKFKSNPCEKLKVLLKERGYKFEEEYSDIRWNKNYSLDIAFLDKKIAIEINGNQHYKRNGLLTEYYQIRHDYLTNLGWIILEIHYSWCFKNDKLEEIFNAIENGKEIDISEHVLLYTNKKLKNCKEKIKKEYITNGGQLDNIGRMNSKMISRREWERRKNLLLNAKTDMTKFGWVGKMEKETNMTKHMIEDILEHFPEIFEGKFFRRKI